MSALFGLDSLKRKFGPEPPREWDAALLALTDAQLQHGLNSLLKSGRGHLPTLPEFIASCRDAREWTNPVKPEQQIEDQRFDKWDCAANIHLLNFILKQGGLHAYYDAEQTAVLVEWKNAWARDCRDADAGEGVPVETQRAWWKDCMARAREALAGVAA